MPTSTDILSRISISSVVDVLVVAMIFYWLLTAVEGTRAIQLLRGVIILLGVSAILGVIFKLSTFGWLIRTSFPALLLSIPVVFQPELRRALERLGRTGEWFSSPAGSAPGTQAVIGEISSACSAFSRDQRGALIVLERDTGLQEYTDRGVPLDAVCTAQLLSNIFYPNSPLHDGAVIVRHGRITSAGCVLPLSDNVVTEQGYGMRHRAALGISEFSDAVAIVVSEETGKVSVAHNGKMTRDIATERIGRLLVGLLKVRAGKVPA